LPMSDPSGFGPELPSGKAPAAGPTPDGGPPVERMHPEPDREGGSCDLCGLPLRFGPHPLAWGGRTFRFCCNGCRQVFRLLSESTGAGDPSAFRETDTYRKCLEMGILPGSEAELEARARAGGNPGKASEPPGPVPEAGSHALDLHLAVTGMWCPACAWLIETALVRTPGVVEARCHFSTDRIRCRYDPVRTTPAGIMAAVGRLGYRAAQPEDERLGRESRRDLWRFAISAFLTMNVMMLSFALYSGFFSDLDADSIAKLSWPAGLMAAGVLAYGGYPIFRRAWSGLRGAAHGMETLISAGSLSAFGYSCYGLLRGSLHLYFDTAAMLITLVLLGKLLERGAKRRIQEDLESFQSLRPTKARICTPAFPGGRYADARLLSPGDGFRLEEGEIAPADGVVTEGEGSLDESSLTGEAAPVPRKAGDRVRSGSRVIQGNLKIRAEAVGGEAVLGQMIDLMERALERKTRMETGTDRMLRFFVPAVLALSALTGAGAWAAGLSAPEGMIRAVTVMVISCPCALGIAIPLARVAGISIALRQGIVVRDFSAFEKATRIDTVVFDKTGTLTEGNWRLRRILPLGALSEAESLALAAALEADVDHPAGRELRKQAAERGLRLPAVEDPRPQETGVAGVFKGEAVRLGPGGAVSEGAGALSAPSRVQLSRSGKAEAVFEFGDSLREGVPELVAALTAEGITCLLVSGDGEAATRAAAEAAGIAEARGGLMPAEKASLVDALRQRGRRVAMVGDGVNDAPAMVRAELGIAVHAGHSLAREAADVTLMGGDPARRLDLISLSRRVGRKVSQNLFGSVLYNAIGIPIAMTGLLNPLVAVCAMLLSSLSVTGNTLLLVRNPGGSRQ